MPLSLAVIYDSLNHGSWERISRNVGSPRSDEQAWITEYVRKRHFWLSNIERLKATSYRTKFFLDQIMTGNWELSLPLMVHGFRLTDDLLPAANEPISEAAPAGEGAAHKGILESAGEAVSAAADRFDRVDNVVTAVTSRKDAAKSLWTTIIGTVWQVIWAIFGFVAGLPAEVWIVVAVVAALLMLLYLYRQIELGRIRERTTPSAAAFRTRGFMSREPAATLRSGVTDPPVLPVGPTRVRRGAVD